MPIGGRTVLGALRFDGTRLRRFFGVLRWRVHWLRWQLFRDARGQRVETVDVACNEPARKRSLAKQLGADLDDDDDIVGRQDNAAVVALAQQGLAPALLAANLALLGEGRRFLRGADSDRVVVPEGYSRRIVTGWLLNRGNQKDQLGGRVELLLVQVATQSGHLVSVRGRLERYVVSHCACDAGAGGAGSGGRIDVEGEHGRGQHRNRADRKLDPGRSAAVAREPR